MDFSKSIPEIVRQRFSCRAYLDKPIDSAILEKLQSAAKSLSIGPLGSTLRFDIVAAIPEDENAIKGISTYGFIKKPQAFIVATVSPHHKGLEDLGFALEQLVLLATDTGLGSCWIGATISKTKFAKKLNLQNGEIIPAIITLGYIENLTKARNSRMRKMVNAINRIAWEQQFFTNSFGNPLTVEEAGKYTNPLEMVRLGPSASNKQPWRIVKEGPVWHFFLQRTKGYGGGIIFKLLKVADIQRLDMGIAMCHFELTARELKLKGQWIQSEPHIDKPERTDYCVSWKEA